MYVQYAGNGKETSFLAPDLGDDFAQESILLASVWCILYMAEHIGCFQFHIVVTRDFRKEE